MQRSTARPSIKRGISFISLFKFGEHRRGMQNNTDESVPIHFNQPKHILNDVQLIPMLHINSNIDSIRRSMEHHWIERAGTLKNGISRT